MKQTNLHPLIAAQEKAENLETTIQAYAQSQSELLVERDALKRALDSKEKYIEQITNGGIEANNQLTEEVKQLKTSLSVSQSQVQQLKDQFKTQQAELDATLKLKANLTDDKTTLITQLTASRRAVTEQKETIANLELGLNETKRQLSEEYNKSIEVRTIPIKNTTCKYYRP